MDKKVSKLFGMDATHRFHLLSLNSAMYLWSYASKHYHSPLGSRWYTRLSPLFFSKGWESDAKIQKFFARWRDETRMDGAVAIQDRSEPSNTFLHWEIEWRVSLISTLSFALRKKKNKWQWLKNQEWLWPRRHVIVFFFSSFPLSLTQKWIFLPFLQIE